MLVASSGDITLSAGSLITAGGGAGAVLVGGGGSGGAIRLIANTINGGGALRAYGGLGQYQNSNYNGGNGAVGRIRVEAIDIGLTDGGNPPWTSSSAPGDVFPPANAPMLRVVSIDSSAAPADPLGGILTSDLSIENSGEATVNIEATNIPAGTTVNVRAVPARGSVITATSTPLADIGGGVLQATAQVTFPPGRSEVQLRANWMP